MYDEHKLASILSQMYRTAPVGDTVVMIHLFGIRYASEIKNCGKGKVKNIVRLSDIPNSYQTEVSKGVHLARYVIPLDRHKV